jgi:hypothetical protein
LNHATRHQVRFFEEDNLEIYSMLLHRVKHSLSTLPKVSSASYQYMVDCLSFIVNDQSMSHRSKLHYIVGFLYGEFVNACVPQSVKSALGAILLNGDIIKHIHFTQQFAVDCFNTYQNHLEQSPSRAQINYSRIVGYLTSHFAQQQEMVSQPKTALFKPPATVMTVSNDARFRTKCLNLFDTFNRFDVGLENKKNVLTGFLLDEFNGLSINDGSKSFITILFATELRHIHQGASAAAYRKFNEIFSGISTIPTPH